MSVTTARDHRRHRSLRLSLVAGVALAIATPALAGADSPSDPATTPTTVPGKAAPAATTVVPTDSAPVDAAPAAAVAPLGEIDIAATGPGIELGTAIDGATAVANLELPNMPVAVGATVAEYSISYSSNMADPDNLRHYGSSTIVSTAQSDMPAADILAGYQAVIETLGAYEATTATASSEGVTSDRVELDPVSGEGSDLLGRYEVIVSRSEEFPGLVAIELTQYLPTLDGPAPALPAAVAAEFAVATDYAAANSWTTTAWSYSDGFNQYFGGNPIKSLDIDFTAGTGTEADLEPIAAQIVTANGTPSYEDVASDRYYYQFEDDTVWVVRWSEYAPGNELEVSWSLTV
ncbi:MAG: hypothetical protein ACK5OX_04175 [Desertimonas sp.]